MKKLLIIFIIVMVWLIILCSFSCNSGRNTAKTTDSEADSLAKFLKFSALSDSCIEISTSFTQMGIFASEYMEAQRYCDSGYTYLILADSFSLLMIQYAPEGIFKGQAVGRKELDSTFREFDNEVRKSRIEHREKMKKFLEVSG